MMQTRLKSKRIQAIIALAIAAVLVLSGAFAWYTFSQNRINTFKIKSAPGVNLHDDFEGGPNKDVYVENSSDDMTVFVRVRLTEFLQTQTQGSLINGHTREDDTKYWFPHNGIGNADTCEIKAPYILGGKWPDESFHDYFTWKMGGQKYYKTAVALLGDAALGDDPEVCNDLTEYDGTEEDVQQTLFASVITMAQWIAGGYTYSDGVNEITVAAGEKAQGNFWVVDTDGWCYWAQPLAPRQATGLLLDRVDQTAKLFDSDANYCIDVWLQAVDNADVHLLERTENGGVTDSGRLFVRTVYSNQLLGENGAYEAYENGTFRQLTDEKGQTVNERMFFPIGEAAAQAVATGTLSETSERLYIGDTFKLTHLIWDGEDYINYGDFTNAPYYNIGETGEEVTLISVEVGADGVHYLVVKDSAGDTLYLSSTVLKPEPAQIAAFAEGEEDEETPEPEPPSHEIAPQFDKYIQSYPGTGPFAVMYQRGEKIGTEDDTRYDIAAYEARYFYHIGSGVYVEVEDKNAVVSTEITDGVYIKCEGAIDYPNTTYYFSNKIFSENSYHEINNIDGGTVADKVEAAFSLTLAIGEHFGYYDAPNTGYSTVYKGDEMLAHQQPGSPNKISRTFTMKPIYKHTDGQLYIETTYKEGESGWQLDQDKGNINSDFFAFIMGMGANGEFGVGFFGVMMNLEEGEMVAPTITAPQGAGTSDIPFQIESRAQMDWVTSQVASGHTFENEYLKIADHVENGILDMSAFAGGTDESADTSFTPIGTDAIQFKGHFDGNDKIISNLKVSGSYNYRGLFGYVGAGGVVTDVTLVDADVNGNSYVGGIAGRNDGAITDCTLQSGTVAGINGKIGGVSGESHGALINCTNFSAITGSGDRVGGVLGNNEQGAVSGCINKGEVNFSGSNYVGGVVGYTYRGTVQDSNNMGRITGKNQTGGVVGDNHGGVVTHCANKKDLGITGSGTISGDVEIGGVAGRSRDNGTVSHCDNDGAVTGNGNSVGGVVGASSASLTITNCTNTGSVEGKADYTGGISGYNNRKIETSSNTGAVKGKNSVGGVAGYSTDTVDDCENTGAVSGIRYVGGIAGNNTGTIEDCTVSGLISVLTGGNETDGDQLGGVAGASSGTVTRCTNNAKVDGQWGQDGGVVGLNTGTVSSCKNYGEVKGYRYGVGGIVGHIPAGAGLVKIENCENNGVVTSVYHKVGGIVGTVAANAEVTECTNNADVSGNQYIGGIVGRIEANIKVTECTNNAKISGSHDIGGIAGQISDNPSITSVIIKDCTNTALGVITASGGNRIAGILGCANNVATATVRVEGCTNNGTVNCPGQVAGGIAGFISVGGTVTDCVNSGKVTANQATGGIVGNNKGTVTDCENSGDVTSTNSDYTGGIVGYSEGSVTGCDNSGVVVGKTYTGGIVGYIKGAVTVGQSSNTGNVSGNGNVGGVVGWVEKPATGNALVTGCENKGTVTGSFYNFGGVVGYNNKGTIEKSYSESSLVKGSQCVGGVVGLNYGSITNCYAWGDVTSTGSHTGGVVGENNGGTLVNTFHGGGTITGTDLVGGIAGSTKTTANSISYSVALANNIVATSINVNRGVGYSNTTLTNNYAYDMPLSGTSWTNPTQTGVTIVDVKDLSWFWWSMSFKGSNGDFTKPEIWTWDSAKSVPVLTAFNTNLTPPDGSSESKAYLLNSRADLDKLSALVTGGTTFEGKYLKLEKDIDMGSTLFEPIGAANVFNGKFDGNGKTISNLKISKSGTDNVALFVALFTGGEVKNLTLLNAEITGGRYVGSIAGTNVGTITNVTVQNSRITATGNQCGGIAGMMGTGGSIVNCSFEGSSHFVNGVSSVGGIVGAMMGGGNISGCTNTAPVKGNSFGVGGIVGVANGGTVSRCGNTGSVEGDYNIGGVMGGNSITLERCFNTGSVKGTYSVGGVVGNNSYIIKNCYAWGNVTGTGVYTNTGVGGVVGTNGGDIEYSYHASGAIKGVNSVGGIVGSSSTGGTMMYCVALATSVTADPDTGYANKVVGSVNGGGANGSNCYSYSGMPVTGNKLGGNQGLDELSFSWWQDWDIFKTQVWFDIGIWRWDGTNKLPVLIGVTP